VISELKIQNKYRNSEVKHTASLSPSPRNPDTQTPRPSSSSNCLRVVQVCLLFPSTSPTNLCTGVCTLASRSLTQDTTEDETCIAFWDVKLQSRITIMECRTRNRHFVQPSQTDSDLTDISCLLETSTPCVNGHAISSSASLFFQTDTNLYHRNAVIRMCSYTG
jgi:hypothetical protein